MKWRRCTEQNTVAHMNVFMLSSIMQLYWHASAPDGGGNKNNTFGGENIQLTTSNRPGTWHVRTARGDNTCAYGNLPRIRSYATHWRNCNPWLPDWLHNWRHTFSTCTDLIEFCQLQTLSPPISLYSVTVYGALNSCNSIWAGAQLLCAYSDCSPFRNVVICICTCTDIAYPDCFWSWQCRKRDTCHFMYAIINDRNQIVTIYEPVVAHLSSGSRVGRKAITTETLRQCKHIGTFIRVQLV